MARKKKEQRRKRKEAASASSGRWLVLEGGPNLGENSVHVPADDWFAYFRANVLEQGPLGRAMDGIMRNTIRSTVLAWTRQFAAIPALFGKNSLWLQLLLTDEDRVIQGKFYGFGGRVSLDQSDTDVVECSRNLFTEAVPFLLQGGATDHWVFSRSMFLPGFNGSLGNAVGFPLYDPLNCLLEFPEDMPSGVRCTEAFVFLAGDFPAKDGFCSREAIVELLHELNSPGDVQKIHGFWVCAASAKVSEEKLGELKGIHIPVRRG